MIRYIRRYFYRPWHNGGSHHTLVSDRTNGFLNVCIKCRNIAIMQTAVGV